MAWRLLEALRATRRAIIQRPLAGKFFPHSSTEILLYIALGSSCGFVDSSLSITEKSNASSGKL
ncbi:hypothetical protein Droror1_Dr00017787, partial [Drosera rotundifolia]